MSLPPSERPSGECVEGRSAEEAHEWAALAAIGALPQEEAELYSNHLSACTPCRSLLDSHLGVVGELAESIEGGAPGPGPELKGRLLSAAASKNAAFAAEEVQLWKGWGATAGDSVAPGIQAVPRADDWESIPGAPGVSVRRLLVDDRKRTVTMLIRMTSGSSYPPHRHAGREECFVLDGDLRFDDQVFRSGDYLFCEAGSQHSEQWTQDGCELLIVSSLDDELLV